MQGEDWSYLTSNINKDGNGLGILQKYLQISAEFANYFDIDTDSVMEQQIIIRNDSVWVNNIGKKYVDVANSMQEFFAGEYERFYYKVGDNLSWFRKGGITVFRHVQMEKMPTILFLNDNYEIIVENNDVYLRGEKG